MKKIIFTKSIAILIMVCALTFAVKAQTQGLPVLKSRLVKILQEKSITNDFIISTIERNGVDFELPTAADEAELRRIGADDNLIKAIRANYRGAKSQAKVEPDEDNQCPSKIRLVKIFEALKSDEVSQAQVIDFVKRCGVDFPLNDEVRGELSKAGARAALLEAIAANYRSSGGQNTVSPYKLGDELFVNGKYAEAIEAYKKGVATNPTPEGYYNISMCYFNLKQYQEAGDNAAKAVKLDAKLADAWMMIGSVNYELSQWKEAVAAYKTGISLDPTKETAFKEFITYATYQMEPKTYEVLYRRSPVTKSHLISVLRSKSLQTQKIVGVVTDNGVNFKLDSQIEKELLAAGAHPTVIDAVRGNYRDVKQVVVNTDPDFDRGIALMHKDKYREAIEAFKKTADAESNSGTLLNISTCYIQLDEYAKAIPLLEKAIAIDPENHIAFNLLGISYYELDQYANAVTALRTALKLDSSNAEYKSDLALAEQELSRSGSKPKERK